MLRLKDAIWFDFAFKKAKVLQQYSSPIGFSDIRLNRAVT